MVRTKKATYWYHRKVSHNRLCMMTNGGFLYECHCFD